MGQLDAVLGNPATRRTFLKGTGVLAASGILAACRKNVDESGAGQTATSSIGPIEDEPGVLRAHEWNAMERRIVGRPSSSPSGEKPDKEDDVEGWLKKFGGK